MAPGKHVPNEDSDGEVMRDFEIMPMEENNADGDSANIDPDISIMDIDVDMSIIYVFLDDKKTNL